MERLCLASLVIVSVVFFVEATTPDCPPGVGDICGGSTGKLCCSGLVCKQNSSCPDAGGICVLNRIANVGDSCGGNSGKNCRAGLYCKYGSPLGANGRCVPRNCKRDRRSEGGFGEYCNFFTGHFCEPCYECCPTGEIVDDGGICLPKQCGGRPPPADCGEQCGTYAGIICKPPQVCVLDDPDPNVFDGAGICLPKKKDDCQEIPGAEGCPCGGIAGLPCIKGLECKLDGSYPDAGGICIPKDEGAGPGECCGGKNGRSCRHGLVCKLQGNYPGAGGKCYACDKWKNEFYSDCGTACPKTCENYKEDIICILPCVVGCFCKPGQVRRFDGKCINIEDCPRTGTKHDGTLGAMCGGIAGFTCRKGLKCDIKETYPDASGYCVEGCDKWKNEFYTDCGTACPKTCENYKKNIRCTTECVEGCFCKGDQVRRSDGKCINIEDCPKTECDKSKGEEYTTCGSACPKTCDNYDKDMACTLQCVEGCFCPYGTVRDPYGNCIDPKYCWKKAVHEHQD